VEKQEGIQVAAGEQARAGAASIFLLAILDILMYQILAPLEEHELPDQCGPQFENYRRSVPRFVPHLGRRRQVGIPS
jgi:protein-S-isoprenylcysteine O-methyltransferase Ste14